MLKLFKNFNKKDIIIIILCIIMMFFQVWIELKLPDYMSNITRLIQTSGSSIKSILHEGTYMLLCAFGSAISTVFIGYLASKLSASFSMNLREKLFKKVQKLGANEINKFQTSSLITRTTNDVSQIEMLIAMGLQAMIKAPIMATWAIKKIIGKSAKLSTLVAIGVIILLITISIILIIVNPLFKKIQKLTDKINNVTRENLIGVRVIRAFNAEAYQGKKFSNVNSNITNTHIKIQKTFALLDPIISSVMHFLTIGIYYFGTLMLISMNLKSRLDLFSNMVVFTNYGIQVIMSFIMLTIIFMILPRANVSAKRINEVLESHIQIKDGKGALPKEPGTIEFKNVSFKYPNADDYLLKDISFSVKKGETIAFIGSTGSGKSTLINLIPRFYDATEGEILVDGINIKDYTLEELHNIIGYVSQKAFMFTGSIKENIKFGKKNNYKITEDIITKAIEVSQASDFVNEMKNKENSHIARGGTNISGGQKQRLSIARAIARNPEIYIFDDTFSALDYTTDAKLRKALKEYTKDATSLIVAQRIGTIINADKIIVLDKGKCVGIGTHKELLKKCKVYKEIALSQLSEEELQNA